MSKPAESAFHVLLDGKPVGPYNRRTIVGMRLKHTLSNKDVLVAPSGGQLTVGTLLSQRSPRESSFDPSRTSSRSVVVASYTASLYGVEGMGFEIPLFDGEIEARVQEGVLRLAGRYKQSGVWKDDRIKLPLPSVVHARAVGSRVDLWLKPKPNELQERAKKSTAATLPLQSLSLELFAPESAGDLMNHLPAATLPPRHLMSPQHVHSKPVWLGWVAGIGVFMVLGLLAVVAFRQKLW
jgi:hypothetical protein